MLKIVVYMLLFSFTSISFAETHKEFDIVYAYSEGVAPVIKNNKWGAINESGKLITPVKYERVDFLINGMARFQKNDKWGFLDKTGKVIIQANYDNVGHFHENGLAPVTKKINNEMKKGFINKKGQITIPIKYDEAFPFFDKYTIVSVKNKNGLYKFGLLDSKGIQVIPFKYDFIKPIGTNLFAVKTINSWKILNLTTKKIIPVNYSSLSYLSGGLILVSDKKGSGYINKNGKVIIPTGKYTSSFPFADEPTKNQQNLAPVTKNGNVAFINNKGKEVIPFGKYQGAFKFIGNLAFVKKFDKWGVIDSSENTIIPFEYDDYFPSGSTQVFGELLAVKKGQHWGFIDTNNKEVIPFIYNRVYGVYKTTAMVERWGDRHFIDSLGNPMKGYIEFAPKSEGLQAIERNGKYCFINEIKETVIPCEYDWVLPFSEGLAIVNKGLKIDLSKRKILSKGKFGVIDKNNAIIIPFEYDQIHQFKNGKAIAVLKGKTIYIDKVGNQINSE